jgi:MFS family permease
MRSLIPARFAELGEAFRWLLLSDALMLLALMVGQVALPWWIASAGGARDLAIYGVATSLLAIVAMPVLSPLGDRFAKRRTIQVTLAVLTAAAVVLALLAWRGRYDLHWLLALGAVSALASAALLPATNSLSPELVAPAVLPRAFGLQQGAQATGRMIGPAIGGAVLGVAGIAAALGLHGVLLAGAALAARRLPAGVAPKPSNRSWRADLLAGMRANWHIPIERGWILANFVSWIFLFPAFTMLVPLKVQSLGLSGTWLGLCEAGLSLGMLLGSLGGSAWLVDRFGRFPTRVGAAVVQGLALALAGAATNGPALVASFAVAGFMNAALVLVGKTHRMLARPQAFRARMVASAVTTMNVAGTIGPALAGAALTRVAVGPVFVVFGLVGGFAAFGLALVPGFRAFLTLDHEAVDNYYGRTWPQAFSDAD